MEKALSTLLIVATLLFFTPLSARAACSIAKDTDTQAVSAGSQTSLTWSHTITGTDTILFVGARLDNNTQQPSGVTYNGVAMTKVNHTTFAPPQGDISLWYLVNPASGANNITISGSPAVPITAGAISFTCVNQSLSYPATDGQNTNANGTNASSLSVSVTTIADNSWVVGFIVGNNGGTFTAGAGTTRERNINANLAIMSSGAAVTPAGSKTLNVNAGASNQMGFVAASLSPSGGGAPAAATFNPYYFWDF